MFVFIVSTASSQKLDCKKALGFTPYVMAGSSANSDSVAIDHAIFKECGKLDSIDLELVKLPTLGFILLQYPIKEKKASYQSVLNSLNEYKKVESILSFVSL